MRRRPHRPRRPVKLGGPPVGGPVTDVRTGTRWGRSAVALVVGLTAAGGLGACLATGALATTMVAQGGSAQLTASSLYGKDFGIVATQENYEPVGGAPAQRDILRLAFANGLIDQLCIAEPQNLLGVSYVVKITAGAGNTWDVAADHIILDLTDATGVLNLDGWGSTNPKVQIGADAAGVAVSGVDPTDLNGPTNWWGIKAGIAKFGPVTATVQQMSIRGALTAPKLRVQVLLASDANATCPAPAAPIGSPP